MESALYIWDREVVDSLAIEFVAYAYLDSVEIVEYVALHHDERSRAVHHHGVLQCYEIEPSATAWTTSSSAKLMTDLAQLFSYLVKQLGWEWTFAYTCAVCLEDTIYLADMLRSHTQTGASTCAEGIAGGYEWIGTKVDVKQ